MAKKTKGKKTKTSKSGFGHSYKGYSPCYLDHPVIKIGGGTFTGGSCSSPVNSDQDILIGLDHGMKFFHQKFPWEDGDTNVCEFQYKITDMSPPSNAESFKKMIEWLSDQYAKRPGLRVHVGCIGGHGRTGMVLAALVREINGTKDAIQWTRTHYCKKAVETDEQVAFLVKHFGVKTAEATKGFGYGGYSGFGGYSGGKGKLPTQKSPSGFEKASPVSASWAFLDSVWVKDKTFS